MYDARFCRRDTESTLASVETRMASKERRCTFRLGCCLSRQKQGGKGRCGQVRQLALRLYEDKSSTFSRLIDGFVACTRESQEQDPHTVMRRVRQFLTGMRHYLREHAAPKLFKKRRRRRGCKGGAEEEDEVDIEAEEVLQELVVSPLQEHVSRLLEARLASSGATTHLAANMAAARARTPQDLGAGDHVPSPSAASLLALCRLMRKLRRERLPVRKLRHLVACVHALLIEVTSCSERRGGAMSGDDLLPMLVLLVAHSDLTTAELEAEYMWGLLDRASLFSEGGYYLTTFHCAVQAIKNLPAQTFS